MKKAVYFSGTPGLSNIPGDIYVVVFSRDATTGNETNLPGVGVQWTVTDGSGAIIKTGTDVTDSYGMALVLLTPSDISGHSGPVTITAQASIGGTQIVHVSGHVDEKQLDELGAASHFRVQGLLLYEDRRQYRGGLMFARNSDLEALAISALSFAF